MEDEFEEQSWDILVELFWILAWTVGHKVTHKVGHKVTRCNLATLKSFLIKIIKTSWGDCLNIIKAHTSWLRPLRQEFSTRTPKLWKDFCKYLPGSNFAFRLLHLFCWYFAPQCWNFVPRAGEMIKNFITRCIFYAQYTQSESDGESFWKFKLHKHNFIVKM